MIINSFKFFPIETDHGFYFTGDSKLTGQLLFQ